MWDADDVTNNCMVLHGLHTLGHRDPELYSELADSIMARIRYCRLDDVAQVLSVAAGGGVSTKLVPELTRHYMTKSMKAKVAGPG